VRTLRLIKCFTLEEKNRALVTLGAGVRLNPEFNRLELEETAAGFSTDPDLQAKTWATSPSALIEWLGFEAVVQTPVADDLTEPTSIGFRLSDGTDEFWWDGGAWVVNTTSWNTEAEVANNIVSFAPRTLQIVVNLVTTDASYTPVVRELKVLWRARIEYQEDLVYRSIIPTLRENIRPISDFPFEADAALDQVDMNLGQYRPETPYNIVEIDSVFDHTADPDHLVDLLQSYNPTTKIVEFSSTIPQGNIVWIRFIYEPEIAVTTSQEFSEIDRVPSLVLDDINLQDSAEIGASSWVANKDQGTAVKLPPPVQGDLFVVIHGLTDKGVDQQRLSDQVKAFFTKNPILISRGLDEKYSMILVDDYDMRTSPNEGDIHTGRAAFLVKNVLFWFKDAEDVNVVTALKVTGDLNVEV
jgi:hypothetical protein